MLPCGEMGQVRGERHQKQKYTGGLRATRTPDNIMFITARTWEASACCNLLARWCVHRFRSQNASVLENGLGKYLSCPLRSAMLPAPSGSHQFHSGLQLEANYMTCLSNIMLLFSVVCFKGRVLSCVTPACEAHNIRHCIIKLSSAFPDSNNNNKGKVRQPVTVTLYVTALGELTSPFCRRALADCHLLWSPLRALTHESEKMGITHIKEGKR